MRLYTAFRFIPSNRKSQCEPSDCLSLSYSLSQFEWDRFFFGRNVCRMSVLVRPACDKAKRWKLNQRRHTHKMLKEIHKRKAKQTNNSSSSSHTTKTIHIYCRKLCDGNDNNSNPPNTFSRRFRQQKYARNSYSPVKFSVSRNFFVLSLYLFCWPTELYSTPNKCNCSNRNTQRRIETQRQSEYRCCVKCE